MSITHGGDGGSAGAGDGGSGVGGGGGEYTDACKPTAIASNVLRLRWLSQRVSVGRRARRRFALPGAR